MSLGIGLGAFAGGFKDGYGLGKQLKTDFEERKFQNEMKSSYEDSQKKFQEGLAAGTYNEGQFLDVWKTEVTPKVMNFLLKNGRVQDAQAWGRWANGDKGTDYAKLYGKGRTQFGVGDYGGFTNSLNQMAKSAGMDYNFSYLAGDDKNPARIRVSSADGKSTFGDYGMDEVPKLYEQWFNPTSGFHYQTQQANRNTAKAPGIDGGMSMGQGAQGWEGLSEKERWGMYKDVEKSLSEGDLDFYSRPPEEQHKMIMGRIGLFFNAPLSGTNGQPMVLYDKKLGRPVQPADGQPAQGQPTAGDNSAGATSQNKPLPKSEMDYLEEQLGIDEKGNPKERQQHAIVRQDLPETHQVQKGGMLPEPQQAAPTKTQRNIPPGMREVEGTIPDDDPTYIPPKERPIPANKPASREQLFQKWQDRKPKRREEFAAHQDEAKILQMMGQRENPEKILKMVAAKFPYHKRKLMSPEFKELIESYTKGFDLDPKMRWQVKKPLGLGIPFPKKNPKRQNTTIPDW